MDEGGVIYFLFLLLLTFVQFLFSCFGGYFLYHRFSSFSQEKIRYWRKKARSTVLILLGIVILACVLLDAFSELTSFYKRFYIPLFIPLSILFGFCFGTSFWNLNFFEKHPKAKFVLFPLFIWLGMLLYLFLMHISIIIANPFLRCL